MGVVRSLEFVPRSKQQSQGLTDVLGRGLRKLTSPFRRLRRRFDQPGRALHRGRKRLRWWRAMLAQLRWRNVTYVGVTGSCGKTTTTCLTGAVLSSAGEACIDSGRNGDGRVAVNILSIGARTKFCVQELSGSRPGRIKTQVRILRPQIGIITTVGADHYKNFRGLEATAREKARLVASLPRHGTAILNADDPHVIAMAARTRAGVITFGLNPEADIRAIDVRSSWPDRLSLTVLHGEERLHLQTKLAGEYWTTSILAAFACGITCGLDLEACAKAIMAFEPVFGRASVHSMPDGPDYVLETQKAPLWTIANSMAFMRAARAPRKTMVVGTVSDYSGKGGETHRKVARQALEVADRVVFVGPQASHVDRLRQSEFRDRLYTFETSFQASALVAQTAIAGELIYIKASITDHLERIMLSQFGDVTCWRERCGKINACPDCKSYLTSYAPPFGLHPDHASAADQRRARRRAMAS